MGVGAAAKTGLPISAAKAIPKMAILKMAFFT
jgi:hypothetical protein